MNVVDSSGWLEYFAGSENAAFFAPAIEDVKSLLVPSITLLEVFRRFLQQNLQREGMEAISAMEQGRVLELDSPTALYAARLGAELKLPLADSVILASARMHEAVLWTQDSGFEGLDGVKYLPDRRSRRT